MSTLSVNTPLLQKEPVGFFKKSANFVQHLAPYATTAATVSAFTLLCLPQIPELAAVSGTVSLAFVHWVQKRFCKETPVPASPSSATDSSRSSSPERVSPAGHSSKDAAELDII